jgi:hypothetical protein
VRLELKVNEIESAAAAAGFPKAAMIRQADSRACEVFGMVNVDPCAPLGTLVEHWAEEKPGASPAWIEDVRMQVTRAAHREIAVPDWTQLEACGGSERYVPVVTRVRQAAVADALQFDVSLVPFDSGRVLEAGGDPCLEDYRQALKSVEASAQSLVPFLSPIATRYFHDWSDYIQHVVTDGVKMDGPERLDITRLVVGKTKKQVLIEMIVGDPKVIHSPDWLAFYKEVGKRPDIDKAWVLCIDEAELAKNRSLVRAAWTFFKDIGFKTLYCSPTNVRRATSKTVGGHKVIEHYGEYTKVLSLPEETYTPDREANLLHTIFRATTPDDRRLVDSIIACSVPVTEELVNGSTAIQSSEGTHPAVTR